MTLRKTKNPAASPQGPVGLSPDDFDRLWWKGKGGEKEIKKWLWLMIGVLGFFAITALSSTVIKRE